MKHSHCYQKKVAIPNRDFSRTLRLLFKFSLLSIISIFLSINSYTQNRDYSIIGEDTVCGNVFAIEYILTDTPPHSGLSNVSWKILNDNGEIVDTITNYSISTIKVDWFQNLTYDTIIDTIQVTFETGGRGPESILKAIYIKPNTQITAQPTDLIVLEGQNGSFICNASGLDIAYQWYLKRSEGGSFQLINGAINDTLELDNINDSQDQDRYYCQVSGECGTVESDTVTLNVFTNPPNGVTFNDRKVIISIIGDGEDFLFQWHMISGLDTIPLQDIPPYSGIYSMSLEISAVPDTLNNARFVCKILKQDIDTLFTNSATLYVFLNPTDQSVCPESSATFVLGGIDPSFNLQWYGAEGGGLSPFIELENSAIYNGVNTDSLKIIDVPDTLNNNRYYCRVFRTGFDAVHSDTVNLFISDSVNIGNMIEILNSLCQDSIVTFRVANVDGVKYNWTIDSDDWRIIGSDTNYSVLIEVGSDDAEISVTGKNECATDTINTSVSPLPSLSITTHPDTLSLADKDGNASIYIQASNAVSYQWEYSADAGITWIDIDESIIEPSYDGAKTESLGISKVYPQYSGYRYRCQVSGDCISLLSNTATLVQQNKFKLSVNHVSLTVCQGMEVVDTARLLVNGAKTALEFEFKWYVGNYLYSIDSVISFSTPLEGTYNLKAVATHGSDSFEASETIIVKRIPSFSMQYSEEICDYQKGVLITLGGLDINNEYEYMWSAENVSAHSVQNNLNYFIINVSNQDPEVTVIVGYTDSPCSRVESKKISIISKDSLFKSLPDTIAWKRKGDYMLFIDQKNLGILNWGYYTLPEFEKSFVPSSGNNFCDFWPLPINQDSLYWVEVPGKVPFVSRYYYNHPMTLISPFNGEKAKKLVIFPNPASGMCYLEPPSGLQYPCKVNYYNLLGEMVKSTWIDDPLAIPFADDLNGLIPGIYVLRLTDKSGRTEHARLIIPDNR